jgi:hypothetical protein
MSPQRRGCDVDRRRFDTDNMRRGHVWPGAFSQECKFRFSINVPAKRLKQAAAGFAPLPLPAILFTWPI